MLAHIKTDNGLTIMVKNKFVPVARDHRNYRRIIEAINAKDEDLVEQLLDFTVAFDAWKGSLPGDFEVKGDLVYHNGRPFREAVSKKILAMAEEGLDPAPFLNFLRKLRLNPSFAAQQELLLFCEANGFMIHEDGDILAYKSVRENYYDAHTGTVLNMPASFMDEEQRAALPYTSEGGVTVGIEDGLTTVTMPRNEVDDNRNRTCSFGLHFGAYSYASTFSRRCLLVKLNPADVVSIPSDYHNTKGRCCRYQVVAERANNEALTEKQVYTTEDIGGEETGIELKEIETRETRFAKLLQAVCEAIASLTGRDEPGEYTRLYEAGIDSYQMGAVREKLATLTKTDITDVSLSTSMDMEDITNEILDAEDAALLASEGLHEDSTEGEDDEDLDDEGGTEDEDDEEDEEDLSEIESDLEEIEGNILRRIITNSAMFRHAVEEKGYNLDSEAVVEAIQEAGLGGWL